MKHDYRLASLCYLPPRTVGNTDSFLKNIRKFKTAHPLIFYGYNYNQPDVIQLKADPEGLKNHPENRLTLANAVFFTGVKIAVTQGFTHMLALENDCRVGCDLWDDILWKEFLSKNPEAIMGGSPVVINPCSWNRRAAERYHRFVVENHPLVCPMGIAGSSRLAEKQQTVLFTNGALSIYRLDWLVKTFGAEMQDNTIALAIKSRAWDAEIGVRFWNDFEEDAYDRIVCLNKAYSGYGEIMTTEEERRRWLNDKKVVAIHQIKSSWIGPDISLEPEKVSLFVVTYWRDFAYLGLFLKSAEKFARGFLDITILVPESDLDKLREVAKNYRGPVPLRFVSGKEWPDKGFLWHECQIMHSETWCPGADYIAHLDSDCFLTGPMTPETLFLGGKPMLRYERFDSLATKRKELLKWQGVVESCLPFRIEVECMRGHPECYHRDLYPAARALIEEKTGKAADDFIRAQKNDYPQTFTEFPTLGAVAFYRFPHDYRLVDLAKTKIPDTVPYPVQQFWSKSSPDKPQETWVDGRMQRIIPAEFVKQFLG